MRNDYLWTGAAMLALTFGAGCGSEDDPKEAENPVLPGMAGSSAAGSSGGIAPPPPMAGTTAMPPTAGSAGGTAGTSPAMAGSGGSGGGAGSAMAGSDAAGTGGGDAGMPEPDAGMMPEPDAGMMMGPGMCCDDGDCLCHGDPPSAPTSKAGPFKTDSYDISAGCIFYPTDAEPPFAAVAISDGFGGSGGCGLSQTGQWGPLYASWGIVAMIIHTGAGDQPQQRGTKLTAGITAFKAENMKMGSPLFGKLSGRYGTSGFSMGGGGTTFSAKADPTLKSNVSIMAWTPTTGLTVPSLFIFGSSDTLAGTMGMTSYRSIADTVPKMAVTVPSGHAGQPSSGGGKSGEAGLAFQKVFLEGDTRWKPVLLMVKADQSTIK